MLPGPEVLWFVSFMLAAAASEPVLQPNIMVASLMGTPPTQEQMAVLKLFSLGMEMAKPT